MTSATRVSSVVRAFPVLEVNRTKPRGFWADRPRPVTLLPALEAGARFTIVLGGPPTTVREFNSNLVSHEESFVVLGNALLGSLPALKFNEAITEPMNQGTRISNKFRIQLADIL